MANPLKISVKGSSLSCDDYDNNLDILQDRANHVGTQSCNTLNDLDTCLATSATVTTINANLTSTNTRVTNLENSLSSSGSIQNDLNALESALTADINQNRASITALETEVDDLEVRVLGVESNLVSLTTVVTNNNTNLETDIAAIVGVNNNQNARLTTVENRATVLNSNLLSESAARQLADADLQSDIDAEIQLRIAEDNALGVLIVNEEANRITADNTLQTNINSINTTLDNKITVEKNARIAADSNLQVQINSLVSSLSTALPTATVLPYLGSFNTMPPGFLLCAGAAISRTTYANLFALIGTRYGVGNGTTTFNLPDFRDKTLYGTFAGNLDASSNIPPEIGLNSRPISISNMPNHDHLFTITNHTHTVNTVHDHGLNIRPHGHVATVGSHTHSLAPYRRYAEGNGDNGDGGELTNVFGVGFGYVNPNTQPNPAGVTGVNVQVETVKIYPTGADPNIQKTDAAGSTVTSSNNSNANTVQYTATKGNGVALDIRQAALRVNFIIKS